MLMTIDERQVLVSAGAVKLEGFLSLVEGADILVLFVHGSGSSRHSPRNRRVAEHLQAHGLSTLLFDLLTADEERIDRVDRSLRFDIPLLAERVVGATDWALSQPDTRELGIGYFGSSTGAAAALVAAAQRPEAVRAVVSRGGRPDLAGAALAQVKVPTLLIVGELDIQVLALNRQAQARMQASDMTPETKVAIVEGASHLFEEPGTLDRAADLAARWFAHYGVKEA
jgi:putative phosphoribosyl transferase